jgi:ribonuclease R
VAIADVSFYVRAGSRLDREAAKRGNSCYFPDRVVPMLPELISNDLCSLREGELRPCLAVRMRFDKGGTKLGHTLHRGLMRVAKKLNYAEAQEVFNGFMPASDPDGPQPETAPAVEGPIADVLADLWWGYQILARARDRRGPLDLDLPERKILLNEKGFVRDIIVPDRLEAHRLIEEFMIQANVAAAETLEAKKTPCVYRVHAPPSKEKLQGLRDFLDSLGLKLPASNTLRPKDINAVLDRAKSLPVPQLVSEVVLRSQSQAEYAVENEGHFGLNLRRYAHFTSPIRRYADLLVHRGLIAALKLGDDGLRPEDHEGLADVAAAISDTERRAMAAERDTIDRLTAAFLQERVGATFKGRVSGVIKSGLFVRLDDTGADGYIPAASLGDTAWFDHEESLHALVDHSSGKGFRLGDAVRVRLVEVAPMAGALRFEMLSDPVKVSLALAKGYRGRGGLKRHGNRRPPHRRRR